MKRALLPVACLLLSVSLASARTIKIPRQPDYHDGKIAFSYLGDIWVVNDNGSNPRRLTVHTARDVNPRFSPDGKWIAFSSNRYGNYDVFVMAAEGGPARQLTYHSGADTVVGWSRDSKRVVFSAARGLVYPGIPSLYEVPADGGLEQPLPVDWGYWGSYSPDGKRLAYNRHPMVWWRKHYRGSYAADLWVLDVDSKTSKKMLDADLPDSEKPNNFWPMYGNGEIFFVSDREVHAKAGSKEAMHSANNIWKIPEGGGKPVQVTHHKDGSLFFPSISSDGKVIVYEENFGLWKLDTATGKTSEVKIDITSDDKENEFALLTIRNEADSYDLSPSTRRAVISAHGEIFTIATDRGDISRVTHSYRRDTNPKWSPDGKRIAFVSDQSGREEVWLADVDGHNAKKLSDGDSEKAAIVWAPDSKSLAYTASDHKLYLVDLSTGQAKMLASNDVGAVQGPEFSPDGKWMSYTKQDGDLRPHVCVISTAGGEEHRINDDVLFATTGARWSRDGKRLVLLGGYVQGGSAALRQNVASVYSVSLTKEEKDSLSRDIDDEEQAAAADRAAAERGPRATPREAPEVKIDWDGLDRRFRQLTRLSDNITSVAISPDSRTYAFVAAEESDEGRPAASIYTIAENGEQLRRVMQSQPPQEGEEEPPQGGPGAGLTSLQFSKDGRALYFHQGNGIWSLPLGAAEGGGAGRAAGGGGAAAAGGSGAAAAGGEGARKRVNFTVRVEVDLPQERRQIFAESWRVMRNRFYDPAMHGADWDAARTRYEALLDDVGDREELHNVISQMIGEMNASHTGISGGGDPDRDAVQTRYPGFELAADPAGFYKISWVYKRGPADHDYVKLKAGDYLLAVNGEPLKSGDNYWRLYTLAPGRRFELTVNSKPSLDGAWITRVDAVNGNAFGTLQYEKWVEDRRQMVDRLSGGQIGYLHIRQMNAQSLRKFERDLADNHFKKALIVDQRFNPGGGIDQELLEILSQRQYQYTKNRDSVQITRPQRGYFGPLVVMENERSTSDAEVFPDGIRTLKLGKVVGVTTYGAVIGTGAYRLIDGAQLRTPGSGLWNVNGTNLENYGVPPDVYVDNTPEDFLKGRDAQIEKAVEVLKEEMAKH
jgi:tricorn protease